LNGSRPGDWAPVCDGEGSCHGGCRSAPHLWCVECSKSQKISNSGRRDLFGLFSKHYDDVDLPRFESDFTANDFALVLEYQGRPVAPHDGFTCTHCGKRGAEVRPPFSQASTGW